MITDWLLVFLTFVVAVLTFLVWKVYERIAWLTGAMETHSDLMLRIEALRGIDGKQIALIWWDPTIGDPPTQKSARRASGDESDLCLSAAKTASKQSPDLEGNRSPRGLIRSGAKAVAFP